MTDHLTDAFEAAMHAVRPEISEGAPARPGPYPPITRTYGSGAITLIAYPSSRRIAVEVRAENSVMDWSDLLEFAALLRGAQEAADIENRLRLHEAAQRTARERWEAGKR